MPVQKVRFLFIFMIFAMLSLSQSILAQSTAFSYQGRLSDSGNPVNGNYDFQFGLWDSLSGGASVATINSIAGVTVTNGNFMVTLDFGAAAFPGANRYLEIAVRPAGAGGYTTLTPRQPILSTPYAINAAQLGGLAANGFLQNSTSQQAASNFNISGNGTAGGTLSGSIVNAAQYVSINGLRAFTVNGAFNDGFGTVFTATNTFAGDGAGLNTTPSGTLNDSSGKLNAFYGAGAGQTNTTGSRNAFFGAQAGQNNTTGLFNAFFGESAGRANTTSSYNTFFGTLAGLQNTTGCCNAFFGTQAGYANTTGVNNAFFGYNTGVRNTGSNNAFFGYQAGQANTVGQNNAFFGWQAGYNNTGSTNTFIGSFADFYSFNPSGNYNTLLGYSARITTDVSNATAIGALASVTQSNALVLGAINGVNGATADTNVGIGTTAPAERLHVVGNGLITGNLTVNGTLNLPSFAGQFIQNSTTQQANANFNISGNGIIGGNLGIGTSNPSNTLQVMGTGRITNSGSASFLAINSPTNTAALFLDRGSVSPSNSSDIRFYSAGQPDFVIGTSEGSAAASDLSIYNYGTGSNILTIQRSTGNVGIGTTTPFFKLDVKGAQDNQFVSVIQNLGSPVGASYGLLVRGGTSTADTAFEVDNQGGNTLMRVKGNGDVGIGGNVGIGTSNPTTRLHVLSTSTINYSTIIDAPAGLLVFADNSAMSVRSRTPPFNDLFQVLGDGSVRIGASASFGYKLSVDGSTRLGGSLNVTGPSTFDGNAVFNGNVTINNQPNGGVPVCYAYSSNFLTQCASSRRFKKNIEDFGRGLDLIRSLKPVTFDWKSDDRHDIGLIAEEVETVEPMLATYRKDGQLQGVRYDLIGVVLINAVKEQQAQIESLRATNDALKQNLSEQQQQFSKQQQTEGEQQQTQIRQQQAEIAALRQELRQVKQQKEIIRQQQQEMAAIKQLLCASRPKASICKAKSLK